MNGGIYRGVCTQVQGLQIKVRVPQLLGGSELADWAQPCIPPGWSKGLLQTHAPHTFTDNDVYGGSATETLTHAAHVQHQLTPKVGEGVWVMFEGGDVDHPVWMGVFGA